MEDLQTDTLSDYENKNQNQDKTDHESSKDNETCAATLLNGCDESDDPLDLMDHCDNESIGSPNSDVWKGSDSEEENEAVPTKPVELEKEIAETQPTVDPQTQPTEETQTQPTEETQTQLTEETQTQPTEDPEKITNEEKEKNNATEETKLDEIVDKQTNEDNSVIESEDQSVIENEDQTINKESEKNEEPKTNENKDEDKAVVEESHEKDNTPPVIEDKEEEKSAPEESLIVNGQKENDIAVPENEEKIDDSVQEKDPLSNDNEEKEKDPLSNDNEEKDPLSNDTEEKDPLAIDNPEGELIEARDPLMDYDIEKDPLETRRPDMRNIEGQDDDEEEMDYDDDFDPSLLCPEVSMAIDESPVITNSGPVPNDGSSSPLPYEPLFSTYVDEVTGAEISFNLTAEEQELRKRLYGPTNPIQITKIHCTACNVHLGSALEGQKNRFVHPLLKVLICKECYHFYTSGEFEKDEDGSELYCRWCGQGGQVLCCSKCEFVFCKRCIRTNFGRKKMFEIRDSDSWDCLRCVPSQLITQRIACYEFFEYVRREMARANTINCPEIWSKDHSRCCLPKKRSIENGENEVKKAKKKKSDIDPDYSPLVENLLISNVQSTSNASSMPGKSLFSGNKGMMLPKPIQIFPRPNASKSKDNDIEFVRHIPAPQVALHQINKPANSNKAPNSTKSTNSTVSGYRTILPSHLRPAMQPPTLVRINSSQPPPLTPTGSRLLSNTLQGRNVNNSNMMKHEWFEKTVRAAARVNSHLSYTLTQLNKAQSQAASVEELAVVHNKLQEILSSSINSLIQIRKNLRTEFIAGIKTVRLPSKKAESFVNDDDVIFVSAPPTMPMPSTSSLQTKPTTDPIVIIDNSNKTATSSTNSTNSSNEIPFEKPKTYLKVKSVFELQNVPSECITIPDDTPLPKSFNDNQQKETNGTDIIRNGITVTKVAPEKAPDSQKNKTPTLLDNETSVVKTRRSKENLNKIVYNVKEQASPEIKRMLSVRVNLTKVDLEDLQKRLPNGCQ